MRLVRSRALTRPARWIAAAVLIASGTRPGGLSAQATPYVPVADPAYRDLELLVAAGMVRDVITRSRPYSRSVFGLAGAEAEQAVGRMGSVPPDRRVLEALERIRSRFSTGSSGLRQVTTVASWARSPARAVRTSYAAKSNIDADVAPLLQRNLGEKVFDGGTVALTGEVDMRLGSRVAGSLAPTLWMNGGGDPESDAGLALDHGYLRALFGNLSVTLGRNAVVHGHARELGAALSTNARGLDMVRLSMERPARLPWIFRHLGPATFGGTLATMGSNRTQKGSALVVWEGAIRPHPNLELGTTLVNQQGGEGSPPAKWWERIVEALFVQRRLVGFTTELPLDPQIGDKLFGVDARLTLPGPRVQLFVEVNTTDDHDLFFSRPRETFWTEAAWTWGVRRYGLGHEGRWDLWAEAGHVGVRTYTHSQMTSGITLDRRILGSPLGPLASGVTGGVDWTGPRDRLSVSGAWERYPSDTWALSVDPEWRWYRDADNPDEVRVRAGVVWARLPVEKARIRTRLQVGWEHVTRFDFSDQSRNDFIVQLSAGYAWD